MQFYLLRDGEQTGPFSIAQMQLWWRVRMLDAGQLFWKEGMAGWEPLSSIASLLQVPEVAAVAAAAVPAPKYAVRWVEVGEYSVADLQTMLAGGSIPAVAEYWNESAKGWRPIAGIIGGMAKSGTAFGGAPAMGMGPAVGALSPVMRAPFGGGGGQMGRGFSAGSMAAAPKPHVPSKPHVENPISDRARLTYVVLVLALGLFGAHNFYAGHYKRAFAEVLVTVVIAVMVFGGFLKSMGWFSLVYLYILIELIDENADGEGKELQ